MNSGRVAPVDERVKAPEPATSIAPNPPASALGSDAAIAAQPTAVPAAPTNVNSCLGIKW